MIAKKVWVGGLIGTATSEKNGLMSKSMAGYTYFKNVNNYAKMSINTIATGQNFSCMVIFTDVNGVIFTVNLNAAIWNSNKVYASLICGLNGSGVSMSYKIESNKNISVYINSSAYLKIDVSPLIEGVSSTIEYVDSIPSDTIQLSL